MDSIAGFTYAEVIFYDKKRRSLSSSILDKNLLFSESLGIVISKEDGVYTFSVPGRMIYSFL